MAGGAEHPKTTMRMAALLWDVLAAKTLFSIMEGVHFSIGSAFLRSLISCPSPLPDDFGLCPTGSIRAGGRCEAAPSWSSEWSTSAHCHDKGYVMTTSTAALGTLNVIICVSRLLSQLLVGVTAIDALGRKPVVALGLLAGCLDFLGHWFVCQVPLSLALPLLRLIFGLVYLLDASQGALNAMISDLSRGDLDVRTFGYAALIGLECVGVLLVFVASIPVLGLYLTDYGGLWAGLAASSAAAALGLALVLRETQPDEASCELASETSRLQAHSDGRGGVERDKGWASRLAEPLEQVGVMWTIIWQDGVLCSAFALNVLSNAAIGGAITISSGYGIGVLGIRQNVFALTGVVQPTMTVLGSAAMTQAAGKMDEFTLCLIGNVIVIVGLLVTAVASEFPDHGDCDFWVGWACLGFGMGVSAPAFTSLVSMRTEDHNRGKIFSCLSLTYFLGQGLGSYLWSHYLFGGLAASGLLAATGYLVAAGLSVLVSFGILALRHAQLPASDGCALPK